MSFTLLQNLVKPLHKSHSGRGLFFSIYLAATTFILIISGLPNRFLLASYLVIEITVGESFDGGYSHPTGLPLLLPILFLSLEIWLSYPCRKMVEFHYPGFFFNMLFGSKKVCCIYFSPRCNWKSTFFCLCTIYNGLSLEKTSQFQI